MRCLFATVLMFTVGCGSEHVRDSPRFDASADGGLLPDGEALIDAFVSAMGSDGSSAIDPGCAWVDAKPEVVPARLWIVASPGGMDARSAPQALRWVNQAFLDVVLSPTGALAPLEERVELAAVLHGDDSQIAECPRFWIVPPALSNLQRIRETYPSAYPQMQEGAPSQAQYAFAHVASRASQDRSDYVLYVIGRLGMESCANDTTMGGEGGSNGYLREQVQKLLTQGVKTFVLDVSGLPLDFYGPLYSSHAIAAAGGTNQAFPATDSASFGAAVAAIASQVVSCDAKLQGKVSVGSECRGEVRVGGKLVGCNTADGFRMKDASTIELVGATCQKLRDEPTSNVEARFPCDVILY